MKVLHIVTQNCGGAGLAAFRLHLGLKSIGIKSKMLLLQYGLWDNDIIELKRKRDIFTRLHDKIYNKLISFEFNVYKASRPQGLEVFTDDRSVYNASKHPLVKNTDIINLHWISTMINHRHFFSDVRNRPLVWTLHDMNPFTGGCHCAGNCIKYTTGCGACPQLGSKDTNDLSRRIFKRKEKAYKGLYVRLVTPSKWLADCAQKSLLFRNYKIDVIPNGLPTSIFQKRDKKFSRGLLDLPEDKILILFGGNRITENKGLKYLIQALNLLRNRSYYSALGLVISGYCTDFIPKDIGIPVYNLGLIQEPRLLSCCYSAVDMLLIPSLQENFPNVILESFACGIPVVGFDSGGIPEMVRPGETGLLARVENVEELSEKVDWMINHSEERQQMGLNARRVVEREYSLEIEVKRYIKLYEHALQA